MKITKESKKQWLKVPLRILQLTKKHWINRKIENADDCCPLCKYYDDCNKCPAYTNWCWETNATGPLRFILFKKRLLRFLNGVIKTKVAAKLFRKVFPK